MLNGQEEVSLTRLVALGYFGRERQFERESVEEVV